MKTKRMAIFTAVTLILAGFAAAQAPAAAAKLKVFISVDMEGISSLVNWDETSTSGRDYEYFRRMMTEDTNAAIDGALQAGATEIVVRDAHGSARNIVPDLLRPEARLLRDWSAGPFSMMEGIDATFDAVIFVGYHARAGTPDAVLDHTNISSRLLGVAINGKELPEAGINGLMAGMFNVPVVLVTGDQSIAAQAREIFGDIETAVVKQAIGNAELGLHPAKARELITQKAVAALKRLKDFKPFKLAPPYTLEVSYILESEAQNATWTPGAVRKDAHTVSFKADNMMDLLKIFRVSKLT